MNGCGCVFVEAAQDLCRDREPTNVRKSLTMLVANHRPGCNTKSSVSTIHGIHRSRFVIPSAIETLRLISDGSKRSYLEAWLHLVATGSAASRSAMAREFAWSEQAVRTFGSKVDERGRENLAAYCQRSDDGSLSVSESVFEDALLGVRWRLFERGEATLWLMMAEQAWNSGRKPLYPQGVFGWQAKRTKELIVNRVEGGLLGEDFASLLIGRLPRPNPSRRTALPSASRQRVWAKTSGKCVYCAQTLTMKGGQPNSFHVDHVLSVAKGGSDDIANLIPSCATCNTRKSAKPFLTFVEETEAARA